MPSGITVVQTDRPDSPHLKTDISAAVPSYDYQSISEGPGFSQTRVRLGIRENWGIGTMLVEYILDGATSTDVLLKDSSGNTLGSIIASSNQEDSFEVSTVTDFQQLGAPEFLDLHITAGARSFFYYRLTFRASMSGEMRG